MSGAFDKIMAGLDDTRAYLDGDRAGFAVHEIDRRKFQQPISRN